MTLLDPRDIGRSPEPPAETRQENDMTIGESDYEIAHLRSQFDGMTHGEVFEYLSDRRKGQLQTDFVHDWLDADDREAAVFKLIDYGDAIDVSSRLEGSWLNFLETTFKLDKQGVLTNEAFQNFVEQNQ